MKKILSTLIILSTISFFSVHAENNTHSSVNIDISLRPSIGTANSKATLELSDGNKKYTATVDIVSGAENASAHFDVDSYTIGKGFKLKMVSGFDALKYYDNYFSPDKEIELWTYTDIETSLPVSSFSLYGMPSETKPVQYFVDYVPYELNLPARYIDGVLYVPAADGAKSMGVSNITYNAQTGELTYGIYNKQLLLNVGSNKITAFGSESTMDGIVTVIDEYPYIPLLSFAKIVDADVLLQDEGDHINAVVSTAKSIQREAVNSVRCAYINSTDISSSTEYLIWVKKSDYKLRVFKGTKGNWDFVEEMTCAIGKNESPTCTGVFKYYERVKMWPYASYYVGPIMRFNGGYAIHTTLLRYNGVPYDNRVGMKLSHGCVRLQPQDMYRLIGYIPMYTTVYITE